MQPSIFNVRVPLADRDEVFLMNTFTDAQLIVSREVSDLLDRHRPRRVHSGRQRPEREAFTTLAENGFIVESRATDHKNIEDFFNEFRVRTGSAARHRADDAAVQLRVRLLHPGRSRRVQQDRGQDVDGDRGRASPTGPKARMDAIAPKSFALTFFGGEPLLNLPVVYYLAERLSKACESARHQHGDQRHHQRHCCSRRRSSIGSRPGALSASRSRSTATATRTTACGRCAAARARSTRFSTTSARSPIGAGSRSAATSTSRRSTAIRRCSISCASRSSPTSWPKVAFKPIIREAKPQQPKGFIPLTAVGAQGKPLNGTCMTSAGAGVSTPTTARATRATSSTTRCRSCARRRSSADSRPSTACTWARARSTSSTPTRSAPTARSTRVRDSPAMSRSPPDTSTDAQDEWRSAAARRFAKITAWEDCNDCAFIPVCAGGCSAAAHTELGDMNKPNCHKPSFEAGIVTLAHEAARQLALA